MPEIKGIIVDPIRRKMFKGVVKTDGKFIKEVVETDDVPDRYIMPGFIDSHIHIESSMLVPSEFARLAVRHGTVATVSDPHEIANVCGMEGVKFMIENGTRVPLKFYFGAPSCVPATIFETAGATLDVQEVEELLDRDDIVYLAEMMNWPGVLSRDATVMAKIDAALKRGKAVDGHAPGLTGKDAALYASAGITTDHECFTLQEAIDKIDAGMLISIREGSAARNFDALHTLQKIHPDKIMYCSDDKHPDDLVRGHMNELAARIQALGYDLFDMLYAMNVQPVKHYKLDVGLLQPGDPADFVIVDSPDNMFVHETWIDGKPVFSDGNVNFSPTPVATINNFTSYKVNATDFETPATDGKYPVIVAYDGEIVTGMDWADLHKKDGFVQANPGRDILKIAVVNRYQKAPASIGFIKNFGIKDGAIGSTVAHDSHNIVVVGSSDAYIAEAVNLLMESQGGISAVTSGKSDVLPLPVAGLMSNKSGHEVASAYENLSKMARDMGSSVKAPYMLISFMALLVIPRLKISDKGMFDGEKFEFV